MIWMSVLHRNEMRNQWRFLWARYWIWRRRTDEQVSDVCDGGLCVNKAMTKTGTATIKRAGKWRHNSEIQNVQYDPMSGQVTATPNNIREVSFSCSSCFFSDTHTYTHTLTLTLTHIMCVCETHLVWDEAVLRTFCTFRYLKTSGNYMYRQWSIYVPPAVTICTASVHYMCRQRSLYVPHSGHYMYPQRSLYVPPAVTICTAQWSLYVPPVVTICAIQFNIQQFYVLPTQCIYVFCVDLRTNSDYFPIQH
jgi:hypothetical protein